jgi:hypothetical protein
MYTYPYKRTHAHPTPISTSKLVDFVVDEVTTGTSLLIGTSRHLLLKE